MGGAEPASRERTDCRKVNCPAGAREAALGRGTRWTPRNGRENSMDPAPELALRRAKITVIMGNGLPRRHSLARNDTEI